MRTAVLSANLQLRFLIYHISINWLVNRSACMCSSFYIPWFKLTLWNHIHWVSIFFSPPNGLPQDGEKKMKTRDPLIKANPVAYVTCLESCLCVVFLTLDSCAVSDGQKWQKWLVVIEVVALINQAMWLLGAAGWHVPCKHDGKWRSQTGYLPQQAGLRGCCRVVSFPLLRFTIDTSCMYP